MQIVVYGGTGEYEEKKSRFIATVAPATSEEEALAFISAKKKEYWDARHNCFAYVIGDSNATMRCSDDGEPAQTAGRPILDVLLHADVYNVVVVVTRYFGGVLLGTGGLVRAYTQATTRGLAASELAERHEGFPLEVQTDYTDYGKLEFLFREQDVVIESSTFEDEVTLHLTIDATKKEFFEKEIAERTAGRAKMTWGEKQAFFSYDHQILHFQK